MAERYVVLERTGVVRVLDGGYEFASGGQAYGGSAALRLDTARAATDVEVAEFLAKRAEVEARRKCQAEDEAALLALCGLSHGDFSRFCSVYLDGDVLYVRTRENGTNTRSVGAIRNPAYLRSAADDFDSTYEDYEFLVPTSPEPTP